MYKSIKLSRSKYSGQKLSIVMDDLPPKLIKIGLEKGLYSHLDYSIIRALYKKSIRKQTLKEYICITYNSYIGCRLFNHKWLSKDECIKYGVDGKFCQKCHIYLNKNESRLYNLDKLV